MKSPPQQFSDEEAHARTEEFIRKNTRENSHPSAGAAGPSASARKGRAVGTNGANRINGNGDANGRPHHADAGNGRIAPGAGHKANGTSKASPEAPPRAPRVAGANGRKGRLARPAEGA